MLMSCERLGICDVVADLLSPESQLINEKNDCIFVSRHIANVRRPASCIYLYVTFCFVSSTLNFTLALSALNTFRIVLNLAAVKLFSIF